MPRVRTLVLSAVVASLVVVWPIVEYRRVYALNKRLREVDPGRVYRGGELTADGIADAVDRYHIRTILNLQDDFPDPDVCKSFWDLWPMRIVSVMVGHFRLRLKPQVQRFHAIDWIVSWPPFRLNGT